MNKGMLDQQTLDDIIRRIVEVAQPEKIILFGSAARGEMNRHSDVDLLIIFVFVFVSCPLMLFLAIIGSAGLNTLSYLLYLLLCEKFSTIWADSLQ